MSKKLSPSLKSLINAAHARPGTVPAPRNISALYSKIEREALARNLGRPSWLAITTAATMTMNSPDSMLVLYKAASASKSNEEAVAIAELMREVGLKCIGFNGVSLVRTGDWGGRRGGKEVVNMAWKS